MGGMRRVSLLATLVLLVAPLACKRGSSSAEPQGEAPPPADVVGSSKPEGCTGPEDCVEQGTMAFLAGRVEGVAMLEYGCAEGIATGCQNLSTALRSGAVPQDPAGAHLAAKRGCELGNVAACVDLGVDQSLGLGGASQDAQSAYGHFQRGCEAGNALGCRYMGVLHHEGLVGGGVDDASAVKWFDVACGLGDGESCYNAGALTVSGASEVAQLEQALAYMTRACELANETGCLAVEQVQAAIDEKTSKVPGANLRIGSATVNDLTVDSLECRVEGGGLGLLGNLALVGALAERKKKIDACGDSGTRVDVTWTAAGGKITKAQGEGKAGTCVAKVLQKLASPVEGECAATIVIGDPGTTKI